MAITQVKINGKQVKPHKTIIAPLLGSKNVLTNSRWEFVELWLRREKKEDALFFWNQAREFNKASIGLSTQSAPLLHYYSFMNAVKALLKSKSISFNEYHGVTSNSNGTKINLINEGVKIKTAGILPSLIQYLGEKETATTHTLQEILFNLPYIHRTYCLTYPNQVDMFIPLKDCEFVQESHTKQVYFRAKLSADFASRHVINRLPPSLKLDSISEKEFIIKSNAFVNIAKPARLTNADIQNILNLHKSLREDLFFINGSQTLWYAKSKVAGPKRLQRFSATLTLAAMHRLSELCRYKPLELTSFLSSQKNWLLSEFIQQAPDQFLDEIASEITGYQFLQPNIRPAS